jgi:hypothetical protein
MSVSAPLRRPIAAVTRRIRVQRALDVAAPLALGALGVGAALVIGVKAHALAAADALPWGLGVALVPLVGALTAAARRVPALQAARQIDRSHELHDRVASAVSFAALPTASRTPFMEAAIADAASRADALVPTKALPLRAPRHGVAVAGLALAVVGLSLLELPETVEPPRHAPRAAPTPALRLHPDDLDAFREEVREALEDPALERDVRDAATRFEALVGDLAAERLARSDALRRLQQVQEALDDARRADAETMRETLAQLAAELARSPQTEPAARALREADAPRAAAEMQRLSEALRDNAPGQRELERLREALARAAAAHPPSPSAESLTQRREEMERLLRRQREQEARGDTQPESERRLLQRRRRELERLEREQSAAQERQRQLERLQRELAQASQQLGERDREQAAQSLERSAEELNRMARSQQSEEQRRALAERLSELRELMRRQREQQAQQGQQGQSGPQGQQPGQSGQRGQQPGQSGQQGQQPGQSGQQGQLGRLGQAGQGGQPGQQGQQGGSRMDRFVAQARGGAGAGRPGEQGQPGQNGNAGTPGGRLLVPGQAGSAVLEMPGVAPGQSPGGGPGGGQGPGAGTDHDPRTLAEATRLDATRQSTRVQGEQSERGPTRSEVILGAAERGFAARDYRRVYADYASHATEVLEQDQIPGGYRFYVRRYFQLIRPREPQP